MVMLMKKAFVFLLLILLLTSCQSKSIGTDKTIREQNEQIAAEAYKEYEKGADYWDRVDPNIQELDENKVFWVPNGKSYHSTKDCVALLKSKEICSGSLQEAKEEGKDDPCSKCVGD